MPNPAFLAARPVWPAAARGAINRLAGFRALIPSGAAVTVRLAAASLYRLRVDGQWIGHGPARTAHGHAVVDAYDLAAAEHPRVLAVEVCGYHANGYWLIEQPAFLCAEVLRDGTVIAATADCDDGAGRGFAGRILDHRIAAVQRYSFMRSFVEVYRLSPGCDAWASNLSADFPGETLAEQPSPVWLPRAVPYLAGTVLRPSAVVGGGRLMPTVPERPWSDRSLERTGPRWAGPPESPNEIIVGFPLESLAERLSDALAATAEVADQTVLAEALAGLLPADAWALHDFAAVQTGFIGVDLTCAEAVVLDLTFDEVLVEGRVAPLRKDHVNGVRLHLGPGRHRIETLEPYTMRWLRLATHGGSVRIHDRWLRECCGPAERLRLEQGDGELAAVLAAGRATFRQNVVDLPMDCPSRERAAWFGDTFFTCRVEPWLTGASQVERAHLDALLRGGQRPKLPPGMIPMVYPGDHPGGRFIPNWALFTVLQLAEYRERSGDVALVGAFAPRLAEMFAWFAGFHGPHGLLTKLPGWIFVEWSKANELVQDVNAPTNMLYAAALTAAGRLYGRADWTARAAAIHAALRAQAWDGRWFRDRAQVVDGDLVWGDDRTEVCQYYAFLCGTADGQRDAELAARLADDCRPGRPLPEGLHPCNAFIGFYLRLELLSALGRRQQIADELKALFLPMAQATGTLWESDTTKASACHGFASHVWHVALRDLCAVTMDRVARTIELGTPVLPWLELDLPLGPVMARLVWRGGAWQTVALPAGWICRRGTAAESGGGGVPLLA